MLKKAAWIVGLLVIAVLLATPVAAQTSDPVDVVKEYFVQLQAASEGGDFAPLLALFTADATVEVPATQATATGTDEIKALYEQFIGGYLKGLEYEPVGEPAVEGGKVVANYRFISEVVTTPIVVEHAFVVSEGKIQSLIMGLPVYLPNTGGTSALPRALVLAGAVLVLQGAALLSLRRRSAVQP